VVGWQVGVQINKGLLLSPWRSGDLIDLLENGAGAKPLMGSPCKCSLNHIPCSLWFFIDDFFLNDVFDGLLLEFNRKGLFIIDFLEVIVIQLALLNFV
jgi:hypothetical protein